MATPPTFPTQALRFSSHKKTVRDTFLLRWRCSSERMAETKTRWLCLHSSIFIVNFDQHLQLDIRFVCIEVFLFKTDKRFTLSNYRVSHLHWTETHISLWWALHRNFQEHMNISSCLVFSVIMRSQPAGGQSGCFGWKHGVNVAVSSQIGQQRYPDTWTTPYKQYGDVFFLCLFVFFSSSIGIHLHSFRSHGSGNVTAVCTETRVSRKRVKLSF